MYALLAFLPIIGASLFFGGTALSLEGQVSLPYKPSLADIRIFPMWFIGGAPPRLLFFIGQLTSLLIVIYDYPAAHEPGGHTKENEQQNCSCCPNRHCFLSGVDFIAPCK